MTVPSPSAIERQANTLLQQGHYRKAEELYRRALATGVVTPSALGNLAALWCLQERWQDAVPLLKRQLQLAPSHAAAWRNLGLAELQLGNTQAAINAYRQAVELPSDSWQSWFGLANAYREHGNNTAAIESYHRSLALYPANADAANNLGGVYQALTQMPEAIAAYRQAIAVDPTRAETFNNLGIALREIGQIEEAIEAHRQAVALKPGMALAHINLGITLWAATDAAGAHAAFADAAKLAPNDLGLALSSLGIHEISPSQATISACRQRFTSDLQTLLKRIEQNPVAMTWDIQPCVPSFYLSYHNEDDRPLLELLHKAIRTATKASQYQNTKKLNDDNPETPLWLSSKRIGVITGLCREAHVIGHLWSGILKKLGETDDLDVILFHPPFGRRRLILNETGNQGIKYQELSPKRERAEQQIRTAECDLLFYLDVDMVPEIWSLAHLRLAPVQVTSWGTPNTSGMASMDYYISAATIEPDDADMLYTETLIRLSRLPCIYSPPSLEGIHPDREGFNLSSNELLIGIPQSLFKFHPDYDAVLEQIVETVPDARLVMLEGSRPHHTDRLRQRWGEYTPLLLERTVFLPRVNRSRYLILLDSVDILLDPFYFGSGNSFYEAMAIGTPLVTMPGRFMRGRIVAGGYKQMGLEREAPIATTAKEYVAWVERLAADSDLRLALKAKIRSAASQHLFNDQAIATEFVSFFRAAIVANRAGQNISPEWQATDTTTQKTNRGGDWLRKDQSGSE